MGILGILGTRGKIPSPEMGEKFVTEIQGAANASAATRKQPATPPEQHVLPWNVTTGRLGAWTGGMGGGVLEVRQPCPWHFTQLIILVPCGPHDNTTGQVHAAPSSMVQTPAVGWLCAHCPHAAVALSELTGQAERGQVKKKTQHFSRQKCKTL